MAGNEYVRILGLGQVKRSNGTGLRGVLAGFLTRRAAHLNSANGGPTHSPPTTKAIRTLQGSYLVNGDLGRLLR